MSSALSIGAGRTLVRPGQFLDWYPERRGGDGDFLQRFIATRAEVRRARRTRFRRFRRQADRIEQAMRDLALLSEAQRLDDLADVRSKLQQTGFSDETLIGAFAHVGFEVEREFGFRLHREQFFCAWVLLQGMLAEMATGEGKSITAALAAIVAALAGTPVHVITTNDYLVERDAAAMRPLFRRFGLSSGFAIASQTDEERREAYAKSICYVSNKQVVFDYLRDRQAVGTRPSSISARVQELCRADPPRPLLSGLCFAIVDEADSVLIDDAITPLILSQQASEDNDAAQAMAAVSLAKRLAEGIHFDVDRRSRRVTISDDGEHDLASLASGLEGVWKSRRYRLELVRQALSAIHLFERDRDYLVRDGEIVLVDQSTGRVMPDRKLQHGLHQMVETKEKCALSGRMETISSLSFQVFFRRYRFLCGMTGTAAEAAPELLRVYGLSVVPVPTHQRSARAVQFPRFAVDEQGHRALLLDEIERCRLTGRPVLVGTRSVAESERIAGYLADASVTHQVLNARQDEDEAGVVAQAGRKGAVTIATNMAGRGTDIPLNDEVRSLGGLQVIVAELNENQRIDRQLIGRGARQGDPGSYVYIISLTDDMLQRNLSRKSLSLLRISALGSSLPWRRLCLSICRLVQTRNERQQRRARRQVAVADENLQKRLSFSGYKE